jgi:hypothetical protein
MDVLRELGAVVSDNSWGVGGSQEVERLEVAIAGQTLMVEAETYIGLSIADQAELVRRIAGWVRFKQKSPKQPIAELDALLRQLEALEKSGTKPFPYKGCRWLRAAVRGEYHDLVPCLDLYLGDVAGYRSWGRKILRWSDEKITEVDKQLDQSFFERFQAYAALQSAIDAPEATDVREALRNADESRVVLRQLLSVVRRTRNANH